jgi:hypothetical protein
LTADGMRERLKMLDQAQLEKIYNRAGRVVVTKGQTRLRDLERPNDTKREPVKSE